MHPLIHPSIHPCTHPYIHSFIHTSIHPSIHPLFNLKGQDWLPICPTTHQPTHRTKGPRDQRAPSRDVSFSVAGTQNARHNTASVWNTRAHAAACPTNAPLHPFHCHLGAIPSGQGEYTGSTLCLYPPPLTNVEAYLASPGLPRHPLLPTKAMAPH